MWTQSGKFAKIYFTFLNVHSRFFKFLIFFGEKNKAIKVFSIFPCRNKQINILLVCLCVSCSFIRTFVIICFVIAYIT